MDGVMGRCELGEVPSVLLMPQRRRRRPVACSRGSGSPCSKCRLRMANMYTLIDCGLSLCAR